jgi:hypothetical protein
MTGKQEARPPRAANAPSLHDAHDIEAALLHITPPSNTNADPPSKQM